MISEAEQRRRHHIEQLVVRGMPRERAEQILAVKAIPVHRKYRGRAA